MSSGSIKKCYLHTIYLQILYIYIYIYIYIYKQDLVLNNLQRLIGHKTQPTKTWGIDYVYLRKIEE